MEVDSAPDLRKENEQPSANPAVDADRRVEGPELPPVGPTLPEGPELPPGSRKDSKSSDSRDDRSSRRKRSRSPSPSDSSRKRSKYRSRSRSRSRDRRDRSRSRDRRDRRDRSRSRDRRDRSRSRDRRDRSRSRDRRRSRSRDRRDRRSRSRDRERRRSTSRERRNREREENDKKFAVDESEREIRSVFVSNLPLKAKERDIEQFFNERTGGTVREIRLITDKHSHKHKGLGYVEFYQKESVMKALELNHTEFWGKTIEVVACEPIIRDTTAAAAKAAPIPMKLYIGNLHPGITDEHIRELFSVFGELEYVRVAKNEQGMSEGYAYIQYKNPEDAKYAQAEMQGREVAGNRLKIGYVAESAAGKRGPAFVAAARLTAVPGDPSLYGYMDDNEKLDDEDYKINAASRAVLMAKLQNRDSSDPTKAATMFPMYPMMTATVPTATVPTAPVSTAPVASRTPTNYVLLKNMFDPKEETNPDFDQEIALDVKEECEKYGPILHLYVDKFTAGHVYIKFGSVEAAKKAVADLNGRWFAYRSISAEYVSPADYAKKFPGQ